MKTKVGFIGFGLIAGSLAHALKESGRDYHITATSRHLEPVIAAVADGIVDVAAPAVDETFAQCEDRKSTRLNSSHYQQSRMPSSA